MEFRRINGLPPYVFAQINGLKAEARAAGRDVVDFGFGNPDLPSPEVAVAKLAEAVHNPKNHRYSASRGIPNLRLAMANRYKLLFDVDIDPETEVVTTIGAKEGLTHLMWVLLGPGDTAIVPSPSYPIHLAGPGFAGAKVITVPILDPGTSDVDPGESFFDGLVDAWQKAEVKPRVIICSFPHNPTSACVDLSFMERLVGFALEHEIVICHDFAYADLGFDGYRPPSILQVPRAKECCVELYTLTKSFSINAKRTCASPPSPKPTPGLVATSASSMRNRANSSEPISRYGSGMGAHTNIEPLGAFTSQPIRLSPSMSRSRRV